MNSGGGYDGGQRTFGGGGFMTGDSPTIDSSQSKKKYRDESSTLMPVTTAMLHKAEYNKLDETFKFGNVNLHQVKLVGVIREVNDSITNLLYKVDDMTADSIIVRKWMANDEDQAQTTRSECREDTYVRIIGNFKLFQEKRCIVAFRMTPITDFNEISYHMIDVVHSFLVVTKGLNAYSTSNTDSLMHGGMNAFGGGAAITDAFGGGQGTGMSTHQQQVLDAIMSCPEEQGISVQELRSKLRGMNETQVRNSLEFLSNEGHIYSTIDEDHFRSTAM